MADPRSVSLSRRAVKSIGHAEPRLKERIREAVRELAANPLLGKKLKGELEGLRSYRLGSHRIVYRFTADLLEIVHIDDRKDVYR